MDAHFTSQGTGFTGNSIPYAPRDAVHLSADVHFPLSEFGGSIDFGADYTYHSKVYFDNANSAPPFLQQKSIWRDIVNAHVTYESADDRWKLSVWGKNLPTSIRFCMPPTSPSCSRTWTSSSSNAGSVFLAKYYQERIVGVTLTRNF